MLMFTKKYFLFGIFLTLLLIHTHAVLAVGEFQSDYEVNYNVSPNGITIVTQHITLTNRISNLYPKEFVIVIDSLKINNVIVRDATGSLTPQISQQNAKTQIKVLFNQRVVGLGKKLDFTIRYENEDVARKHGDIWEINIPGITDEPGLDSYTVSLAIPPEFGNNAYTTPLPLAGRLWTKEQMLHGGITAGYGNTQTFLLNLSYHIENSQNKPQIQEIALPPDTAFQKITIESIRPLPKNVVRDDDGNWLASYSLIAKEKIDIAVTAFVSITIQPRESYVQSTPNVQTYTKALEYWQSTDPDIVSISRQYATPRDIYRYVVDHLYYDYSRVARSPIRMGATDALKNPKNALCMEFTDLFIAIARAAGIPAREAVGYAYTSNSKLRPLSLVADLLHSWPEYYDKDRQLWVPIDPTWGNTTGGINYFETLDFNHIVLVYHGILDDYPYPAGFYRRSGFKGKDVVVNFVDSTLVPTKARVSIQIKTPEYVIAGLPLKGQVIIENNSGVGIEKSVITIQGDPYPFSYTSHIENITPFSSLTIPIVIAIPNFLSTSRGALTVQVNDQTQRRMYSVYPPYLLVVPILGLAGFISLRLWFVRRTKST